MKILVFDIGGTAIKHAVCTDGILSSISETPTNAVLGGNHILHTVSSLIEKQSGYDAIGISTAGQVNPVEGSIIYANSNIPSYTGKQIRRELEGMFHVPVSVENDVNCAALGEAVYGAGKPYDSFLCLTYGTGVGGAIVENKRIYHGSGYSAAEFGAIVTHGSINIAHGDASNGSGDVFAGCYERYASASALVANAQKLDSSLTNGRLIFDHLHRSEVKEVVDLWIDEIVLGLSSLIHIFNPSCIVMGGGIMAQPYIIEEVNRKIPGKIMPSFAHVKLIPAALKNSAGLLGANYIASITAAKKSTSTSSPITTLS